MQDLKDFLLNKLDKLDDKLEEIKDQNIRTSVLLETHEKKDQELREDVRALNAHFTVQARQLSEYNESLREHIRRTELLEGKILPIEKAFNSEQAVEEYQEGKTKRIVMILSGLAALVAIIT